MAQKEVIINIMFDLIVYDEAGIASGTNLVKGLLRYRLDKKPPRNIQARVLIAGDEHQLKPYRYQEHETDSPLQEMTKTMSAYTYRLMYQWRMHPAIAEVARALTYPYLKDGVTEEDRPFPEKLPKKL